MDLMLSSRDRNHNQALDYKQKCENNMAGYHNKGFVVSYYWSCHRYYCTDSINGVIPQVP